MIIKIYGGAFDSSLFNFKLKTFNVKRKEFCYAGDWTSVLKLGSGKLKPCYNVKMSQNIFEDINEPIEFTALGKNCPQPHCFNSHAFMTLGTVPFVKTPKYAEMRDRKTSAESKTWLKPKMKKFLSTKLYETNSEYTKFEKAKAKLLRGKLRINYIFDKLKRKLNLG